MELFRWLSHPITASLDFRKSICLSQDSKAIGNVFVLGIFLAIYFDYI